MIPITFVPAFGLLALAGLLSFRYPEPLRAPWLIAFLCALALQLILIGSRLGYNLEYILSVQHMTGVAIPPLAYLAFMNPGNLRQLAVHLFPVAVMAVIVLLAMALADTVLAAITFVYASLLTAGGFRAQETLSWAPLRSVRFLQLGLWAAVATLMLSGLTDLLVAADFWATGGSHTSSIATAASLVGLTVLAVSLAFVVVRRTDNAETATSAAEDQELVGQLQEVLRRDDLFSDSELSLNRLARRLKVPSRRLSQAVNRSSGLNVSQFVNNVRVAAASDAMASSNVSVTNAMLEAGFLTKSNFNR